MKTFFTLVLCALTHLAAFAQTSGDKVVYHIDHAASQATKGLRNIRNHLDVAPDTQIVVVTHAEGVDFLMDGAKDKQNPNIDYAALVSALKARHVRFEICEITLKNRNLNKSQFNMDADLQDWVAGAMLERDFLPFEEPYRLAPSATQMPTGLA